MANPTIIAVDTLISGSIEGSEDITLHGTVHGSIRLTEALVISASGRVQGDVHVREAVIEGVVLGEVRATDRVTLGATARVQADIIAPILEMADGAQLTGQLNVGLEGVDPAVVKASTSRPAARPASSQPAPTRPATPRVTTAQVSSAAPSPVPSRAQVQTTATSSVATVTVVEEVEELDTEPVLETTKEASPEGSTWSFEDVDEVYTVKELREELRNMDLAVSGTKAELIERLIEAKSS